MFLMDIKLDQEPLAPSGDYLVQRISIILAKSYKTSEKGVREIPSEDVRQIHVDLREPLTYDMLARALWHLASAVKREQYRE